MGSGCSTSIGSFHNGFIQNVGSCYGCETSVTTNRQIEGELRLQKALQLTEIKLLLLGSGEAGKSTFVKQVRHVQQLIRLMYSYSKGRIIYIYIYISQEISI